MQNGQFGSKIKNVKKLRKIILRPHYYCYMQKKPLQKIPNIAKMGAFLKMAKIGQYAWAIAHAKWSVCVKN